jgi:hypothetical protein
MLVVSAAAGLSTVAVPRVDARETGAVAAPPTGGELGFTPIQPTNVDDVVVPDGYSWEILLRWGDPLFPGAPEFDYANQTGVSQARQFGYNNDFVAFMPLPRHHGRGRPGTSRRGLLWVNHEYVNPQIMFPDWDVNATTRDQADVIIQAVGRSIVELERRRGRRFAFEPDSRYTRRITLETPMRITGPAAGHPLMRTSEDPTGRRVRGMVGDCAGGRTPWGTILTGEETSSSTSTSS